MAPHIDVALPFGYSTSCTACVHVMSAITWIMPMHGHHMHVYVDDFVGCEGNYLDTRKAFEALFDICAEVGIALIPDKCLPPSVDVVWLGLYLDSSKMTISIPAAKLDEVISECDWWMSHPTMTHRALQRLLGCLAHIASCVPPARKFMGHLLTRLQGLFASRDTPVNVHLGLDVEWFGCLAHKGTGVHLPSAPVWPVWVIECNSCLTRGGAFTTSRCFAEAYSPAFMAACPAIQELEAVNLLITMRHLVPNNSANIVFLVNATMPPPPPPSPRAAQWTLPSAHVLGNSGSSPPSGATPWISGTSQVPSSCLLMPSA